MAALTALRLVASGALDLDRDVNEQLGSVIALQEDVDGAAAMLTPHVELPAGNEWTILRGLGVEPPVRAGLGLFLSDGWFSHLGGAHDSFSALWGSLHGSHGVVALAFVTEGIAV